MNKLSKSLIAKIITNCSNNKLQARLRDVVYVVMCDYIDEDLVYKVIFADDNFEHYKKDNALLHKEIKQNIASSLLIGKVANKAEDTLSFDENKAEMIKLIKATQEAESKGEIEVKDSLRIQSDLRTKINDRFKVAEENQSNVIVVPKKCNIICDKFKVECYLPTKEDLMKEYNLIEKV